MLLNPVNYIFRNAFNRKHMEYVTVIYFLISGLFKLLIGYFTKYIDPKNRTPEKILKGVKTDD